MLVHPTTDHLATELWLIVHLLRFHARYGVGGGGGGGGWFPPARRAATVTTPAEPTQNHHCPKMDFLPVSVPAPVTIAALFGMGGAAFTVSRFAGCIAGGGWACSLWNSLSACS